MNKSEFTTILTMGAANAVGYWNDHLEPIAQMVLVLFAVIAAGFMAYNRYLDFRMKRIRLRKLERGIQESKAK
ncbi:MAG: hypothetical protein COB90_07990 [Hyphomicrobiales bacterium]|nr:MAG: hypothetical protein COB90_07990 [Hyphomicrobiales bacterium]